jgi:hypothetical protein
VVRLATEIPRWGYLRIVRVGALLIDGGNPDQVPDRLDAWLVCDDRAELMPQIRRLARRRGLEPAVADDCVLGDVVVTPMPVEHTSHPTSGYLLV